MNDKVEFKIPVTLEIDAKDIVYLLCSAFEGGYMTWCEWETKLADGFSVFDIPWLEDPKFWDGCHKVPLAPLVRGCSVTLFDMHENEKEYTLDLDAIQRGLKIMSDKYPEQWTQFLNGDGDAITGNVFVQCCVFGKEVYD